MNLFGIVALSLGISCTGCGDQSSSVAPILEPPLKPGQILDKSSEYAKKWPGRPGLFKLKEGLILSIPPQYQKFWLQYDRWGRDIVARPPTSPDQLSKVELIGFQMFFPDFGGYTPSNYLTEFDEDIVNVVDITPVSMADAAPGAAGHHIPNVLSRLWGGSQPFISTSYEEKFGMRCYEMLQLPDGIGRKQYCIGQRDAANDEYLLLEIFVPPFQDWVKFPIMQAKYFSKKYDGVEVVWRTHVKHLKDWHRIDQQIWTYIDAWNIAKTN